MVKQGNLYTYYCSYNNNQALAIATTNYPMPWDNTIYLGGRMDPDYETFDGYLKDFKFYNYAIAGS